LVFEARRIRPPVEAQMSKTTLYMSVAVAAALSLSACSKPAETAADKPAPDPVSAAQDATGAAVGQVAASTMGAQDTDAFVSNANQSDMYEIAAGNMAQARSKNADVKAFGKMMVIHHTAMMNEMKPLVAAAGKTPAAALDQRRQGMLDNLKGAADAAFDAAYITQQVAAHNEALTLMKGYADHGDDAGLKAGAAKAIPKIEGHLAEAQKLQGAVK
jgi:putative membrane protein